MNFKLIRKPEILTRHLFKTTCLYQQIADGVFTPPVKINNTGSAWPEYESDAILAAIIAGYSKAELRALVQELITNRAKLVVTRDGLPSRRERSGTAPAHSVPVDAGNLLRVRRHSTKCKGAKK